MNALPNILIVMDYFYPGNRSGGPSKSIENLCVELSERINFYILTRNHDLNVRETYPSIVFNKWLARVDYNIRYCSRLYNPFFLLRFLRNHDIHCIYFNSFFSPATFFNVLFYRLFRFFSLVPCLHLIVSPRGELTRNSLTLKPFKKNLYKKFVLGIGLFKGVRWHFSSEEEAFYFENSIYPSQEYIVSPNFVTKPPFLQFPLSDSNSFENTTITLKLIFLSRVVPKKNLLFLFDVLQLIAIPVDLCVFGPLEDNYYWKLCQERSEKLPINVSFKYMGLVSKSQVGKVFSQFDYFVFPSISENFGHVVYESLSVGTPVITSIFTPWKTNESRSIISLPLSSPNLWAETLVSLYKDPPQLQIARRHAANSFSIEFHSLNNSKQDYYALFDA